MIKRRILLVEDDVEIAELTASLLQSHGYEVGLAHNGKDAIVSARNHPELILLDITLPDMDGYEVCRQLKEDPTMRDIPVIMVTARDALSDRVEGLHIGADDYLTKPFDSPELLARMEAVLRRNKY